jgi:hypothetical protein
MVNKRRFKAILRRSRALILHGTYHQLKALKDFKSVEDKAPKYQKQIFKDELNDLRDLIYHKSKGARNKNRAKNHKPNIHQNGGHHHTRAHGGGRDGGGGSEYQNNHNDTWTSNKSKKNTKQIEQ